MFSVVFSFPSCEMPKLYLVQFCGSEAVSPAVQGVLRGRDALSRVSIGSLPKHPIGLDQTYIHTETKSSWQYSQEPANGSYSERPPSIQSTSHCLLKIRFIIILQSFPSLKIKAADPSRSSVTNYQITLYWKWRIVVSFGKMSVTCQVILKM